MKKLDILAAVLVIVGGLNWGLVAVANFDLVATLVGLDFGETNAASRIVYGLVGAGRRLPGRSSKARSAAAGVATRASRPREPVRLPAGKASARPGPSRVTTACLDAAGSGASACDARASEA